MSHQPGALARGLLRDKAPLLPLACKTIDGAPSLVGQLTANAMQIFAAK
jgi:hypothetical protein